MIQAFAPFLFLLVFALKYQVLDTINIDAEWTVDGERFFESIEFAAVQHIYNSLARNLKDFGGFIHGNMFAFGLVFA